MGVNPRRILSEVELSQPATRTRDLFAELAPRPPQFDDPDNPFVRFVSRYRHDRIKFVIHNFKCRLEPWQREVLEALDTGHLRISVRSGHGVGKTALLAWVIIHFVLCRYPCKVVVTAPTFSQLFDALAAECKRWVHALPPGIQDCLDVRSDRITLKAAPSDAFVAFRTSREEQPEALQGVHADHVLLVVDEASGVPESIFQAAAGSMSTRGAITVLAGNPLRASGYFYNTHTLWERWWTRKVACAESSRVDPNFPEEIAAAYGLESNAYRIRVLGEFPTADEDTFIPLHLVESAMGRDIEEPPFATQEIWGVDVARFGNDQSALVRRKGSYVYPAERWRQLDAMQLVGQIKAAWDKLPVLRRPSEIYVDAIGIGAGVVDRLREMELPAVAVNVAESPSLEGPYHRLRDELWGRCRRWLELRTCRLPLDKRLLTELTVPRMQFTSVGKVKLESKDELRKRLSWSPDSADAFVLTFASEPAVASGLALGVTSPWRMPARQPNTDWVV